MSARFEAVYYPGEDDERLPEWRVVEWTQVSSTGAKSGNTVWKSYNMEFGERDALEEAAIRQIHWEFAAEFA